MEANPTLAERIAQDNAMDLELYRFARGLWARRVQNSQTQG